MKEIAGNLRRDVKDLLGESANIVTGLFKDGLCTVRGAANRWRNFTRDISGAFVSLFNSTNEALLPGLSPEQQPVVTVIESTDKNIPAGSRMTLSEAETRIGELNQRYWDSDEPERPVRVAIDYMLDGEVDRYWLPLRTGPGCGSLLEQMECHVDANLNRPEEVARLFEDAPAGLRELLHEQFGPQLHDDLEKLAGRVLTFFQQHHTITKLEQQFQTQAAAMPQKEKEKFLEYAKAAVMDLRKAANTSKTIAPAQERTAPVSSTPARDSDRPWQSVKVKLHQIKKERSIDILAFLEQVLLKNTRSYQSDFQYDIARLRDAALESDPERRTVYWMSRPAGTWLVTERDAFLRGSNGHTIWTHYAGEPKGIKAYRVAVTGGSRERPLGTVRKLNYGGNGLYRQAWGQCQTYRRQAPGGQWFFRLDSLGDGYTEADIQARLSAARSGEAPPPVPLGPPFCPAVQPLTPGWHTRQDPEAERLSCPLLQIPVSAGGHPETASQAPVCLPDGDHQI